MTEPTTLVPWLAPFICIGCTVDRHELCSAPAHVFCVCPDPSHG